MYKSHYDHWYGMELMDVNMIKAYGSNDAGYVVKFPCFLFTLSLIHIQYYRRGLVVFKEDDICWIDVCMFYIIFHLKH